MSSPLSTSPSPFSSGRGAVRQVLGLLFAYSGPPPSSLITPPSDSNRGTVAQPRCSTDNPVLAPLVAPQAKSFSAPTPTRTTPSTPERESLFAGQHTAHQRSSLQVALQLGLSLLGFVYQDKQGPISYSDTTQCVGSRRVFVCSHCIQWSTRRKAVGIPPRLISVTPASCDWRWLRICPPYAGF